MAELLTGDQLYHELMVTHFIDAYISSTWYNADTFCDVTQHSRCYVNKKYLKKASAGYRPFCADIFVLSNMIFYTQNSMYIGFNKV